MYTIRTYYPFDCFTGEHDAFPEYHVLDQEGRVVAKFDISGEAKDEVERREFLDTVDLWESRDDTRDVSGGYKHPTESVDYEDREMFPED